MRGLKGRGCWRGVIEFGIVIFTLPIFNKDMGNTSSMYTAALWLLIFPCFIEVMYLSFPGGEEVISNWLKSCYCIFRRFRGIGICSHF
jgi:hypothetical protein